MFEGLIEFIEQTVFGLTNKIVASEEENGEAPAARDRRHAARLRGKRIRV